VILGKLLNAKIEKNSLSLVEEAQMSALTQNIFIHDTEEMLKS
jgi:hypothetical protein